MKTLIAIAAIALTTGCSTIVNDRMQPVQFTSPEPIAFTVTSKQGRTVEGFTPAMLTLDSAVGAFSCETYTVRSGGNLQTVDTGIQGWFWFGTIMSLTSMIVDLSTGNMCKLPEEVEL